MGRLGNVHQTMNSKSPSAIAPSSMNIQNPEPINSVSFPLFSKKFSELPSPGQCANLVIAMIRAKRLAALLLIAGLLQACVSLKPPEPVACAAPLACSACQICTAPSAATAPPSADPSAPALPRPELFEAVSFADLPGWRDDDMSQVIGALRASCTRLRSSPAWQEPCAAANSVGSAQLRPYFEAHFVPWRVAAADGKTEGLVTGYYEPLLRGSRVRSGTYGVPLYSQPEDLLTIELSSVSPGLRNLRLRGRIEGRRVIPYFSRAEIDHGAAPLAGRELVWVDDAIEAFFLQIQGSGRIQLDSGETLRLGYADQNGHPYVSIGRTLIERGELRASDASMQGIQAWARANPARMSELLSQNPSYVFFRELPRQASDPALGPPGAMGTPLTAKRSIAVDPRFIPLGVPVYLSTTRPATDQPLNRLVFAQDTGGAIRGAVRADYFWGFGADAGNEAGRMRQQGRLWVLWPKGSQPPRP